MAEPTPDPNLDNPPSAPIPAAAAGSKLLTIGILLAAVAVVAVWVRRDASSQSGAVAGVASAVKGAEVGALAPGLELKDLNGKAVRLADLKGKVVIVDFWATWCEPCTVMIPWFIEFRNRYGPQGLEIVGVAMDEEGLSAVKPYAEKAKMNYLILLGNDEAADQWGGIFGLPTTFLIDRQGRIHSRHMGLVGRDVFEREIRSML